jgi:Concanavalin A-like lectin/glucanases superfamily
MKKNSFLPARIVSGCLFLCLIFFAIFSKSFASVNLAIWFQNTNSVTVAWPGTSLYALQTNNSLAPTNWGAYSGSITNTNGTNSATVGLRAGNQFFRLTATFFYPTNIRGMAYFWNYNDLTVGTAVNNWTDRISGVVLRKTANPAPTNQYFGVYFDNTPNPLTNNAILISRNFSLWYVFMPQTNGSGRHMLFGDSTGDGLETSNCVLDGDWRRDNLSSAPLLYHPPDPTYGIHTNILYSIVDAEGTLSTNGIVVDTGISEPTSNFSFQTLGSSLDTSNLVGYVQYIGIWTNYALSSTDISNLNWWVNNYGVTNVIDGLIGWYRFNEGSGTNVSDASGNGNSGALMGDNSGWTNGIVGGAIKFDGTNYVQIANTNITEGCTNWTVTFWMKSTNLQMAGNPLSFHVAAICGKCINAGINDQLSGWTIFNDAGPDQLCGTVVDTNGYNEVSGHVPCGFSDGAWHFVVCEWSSPILVPKLYMDTFFVGGGIESSAPNFPTETANESYLMIGDDGTHINMTGTLSDFRIYNRALSAGEIYDLYRWRGQP